MKKGTFVKGDDGQLCRYVKKVQDRDLNLQEIRFFFIPSAINMLAVERQLRFPLVCVILRVDFDTVRDVATIESEFAFRKANKYNY